MAMIMYSGEKILIQQERTNKTLCVAACTVISKHLVILNHKGLREEDRNEAQGRNIRETGEREDIFMNSVLLPGYSLKWKQR